MNPARTMPGGRVHPSELPKGANGRSLCRWCNLEVPKRRLTFCSDFCVDEWKLRTDPGYVREKVFERDKGVCARCGVNCEAEWIRLKKLRGGARKRAWMEWGLKPNSRRTLWDADHILPVVEGGGQCDLSNIRTLCLRCHRAATAALREKLRSKMTSAAQNVARHRTDSM